MIIETILLDGAHTVTLVDQTQHYFGGYFHVKVLVWCEMPVLKSYFETAAEWEAVVAKVGASVRFERILEKMAVPESDVAAVRSQLMETFRETSVRYLTVPGFAPRFVQSEYRKRMKKPVHGRR